MQVSISYICMYVHQLIMVLFQTPMSNSNKPSGGRSLKHFVDILEPRRHGSDLAWVFRSMELTKAYDQLRSLSHPEVIKYNVLESEETASIIHEVRLV